MEELRLYLSTLELHEFTDHVLQKKILNTIEKLKSFLRIVLFLIRTLLHLSRKEYFFASPCDWDFRQGAYLKTDH